MTGFYNKCNARQKWVKLKLDATKNWTKLFFCCLVCNTLWNIMGLLNDFTSLFLHPWKDQKTRGFSCLEGVYREKPVAWNGLIYFHNHCAKSVGLNTDQKNSAHGHFLQCKNNLENWLTTLLLLTLKKCLVTGKLEAY